MAVLGVISLDDVAWAGFQADESSVLGLSSLLWHAGESGVWEQDGVAGEGIDTGWVSTDVSQARMGSGGVPEESADVLDWADYLKTLDL